uniref:Uncharacterized protein n=1 Tax=Heterorhabditis bacteriophora TaxID=37862 RepID=A0A1I7XA85_HETBA
MLENKALKSSCLLQHAWYHMV